MPTGWSSVLSGLITVSGAAIEFTALTGSRTAIAQTITVLAGDVLTFSMDVDAVTGTGTDALAIFEVVSGAVLSGSTTIVVSGGTGRKTASTTVTTGGTIRVRIGASVSVNATTNCVATLKAPQIEKRSFATAYTATTTQTITRYQRQLKTAAANEWPREFDPVTGECLGRSVWESRTNLLTYSEEFDNAAWTKTSATILSNQVIAPDGTLTADNFIPDSGSASGSSLLGQTITAAAGTYTESIFVKAAGFNNVILNFRDNATVANQASVTFDLAAATISTAASVSGTFTSPVATITNIGNGWRRISLTCTTTGATAFRVRLWQAVSAGDGFSGVIIWGAQLE
jgi:hypothetical protein